MALGSKKIKIINKLRKTGRNNNDPRIAEFKIYAIPILEKFQPKHLIAYQDKFKEFWRKYRDAYRASIDFSTKEEQKRAANRLRQIKCLYSRKGKEHVEVNNYAIVQYKHIKKRKLNVQSGVMKRKRLAAQGTDQEAFFKEREATDLITATESRIEKKRITEISFASEITRATVQRIEDQEKFKELFIKDYLEQVVESYNLEALKQKTENPHKVDYVKLNKSKDGDCGLNGIREESGAFGSGDVCSSIDTNLSSSGKAKKGVGNSPEVEGSASIRPPHPPEKKRSRFVFQHLTLTNKLRSHLSSIAEDLTDKILTCNPRELSEIKNRLDTITKLIDTTRKLDMQPVYMLNAISEGGFNSQKELQGAVINDKTMVDNGQIILERSDNKEVVDQKDIEDSMKILGSALFSSQLEQIDQPQETIIEGVLDETDSQ